MKSILLTVAAMIAMPAGVGSAVMAAGQTIDAPIKRVTVYQDQARVTRIADLKLPAGDHVLMLEQLPEGASEESFRASATGVAGITILGISLKRVEHTGSPQQTVAELQKQIKKIERQQKRVLEDRLATFVEQKGLLTTISKKAGDQMAWQVSKEHLNVSQWDSTYQFVGSRLLRINDSIRVVQDQIEDVDAEIQKLTAELQKSHLPKTKSSRTVQIDLRMRQEGEAHVSLEYMVPGARWTPLYDARLMNDSGRVELSYNVEVSQHTGEDWKNIELTLSTATPSRGTGPGEFMPKYFSQYVPPTVDDQPDDGEQGDGLLASTDEPSTTVAVRADRDVLRKFETSNQTIAVTRPIKMKPIQTVDNLLRQVSGVQTSSTGAVYIRGGRAGEVAYIVDGVPIGDPLGGLGISGASVRLVSGRMTEGGTGYGAVPADRRAAISESVAEVSSAIVNAGNFTATFTTQRKETIPSGDASVRTTVARWVLEGRVQLISRPRQLDGAYRLVTITNQNESPLMPGRVAIFAGSDFLGNAELNQMIVSHQTFELPFGLDNSLTVSRKLWTYKKSESGDKTKLEYTIKITLVNHGAVARQVQLEEPIPVSRDSRVKISVGEILPKLTLVDESGKGSWDLSINSGDSTVVTIPYRLEYPSWMKITDR